MIIIRDGKEIELTDSEIYEAYLECKYDFLEEDIKSKAEEMDIELTEDELDQSILASIGSLFSWIFAPLGFGTWQATVASFTGLLAKENIVGTMGIFYTTESASVYTNLAAAFTSVSAYAFLIFNLLCAPCFAAMGAIRREMNSAKWTAFAILYQCCFAYAVALIINQFGNLFLGNVSIIGIVAASLTLAFIVFMLIKPSKKAKTQL